MGNLKCSVHFFRLQRSLSELEELHEFALVIRDCFDRSRAKKSFADAHSAPAQKQGRPGQASRTKTVKKRILRLHQDEDIK